MSVSGCCIPFDLATKQEARWFPIELVFNANLPNAACTTVNTTFFSGLPRFRPHRLIRSGSKSGHLSSNLDTANEDLVEAWPTVPAGFQSGCAKPFAMPVIFGLFLFVEFRKLWTRTCTFDPFGGREHQITAGSATAYFPALVR
jgi:hypothetical protein